MLNNYVTLSESAQACLQQILRTTPMSDETSAAEGAIAKLKDRLLERYEAAYPGLACIISYVIEQEEVNARNVSPLFPQLVLPDLVEIHMSHVGLQLALREDVIRSTPFHFVEESPNLASGQFFVKN